VCALVETSFSADDSIDSNAAIAVVRALEKAVFVWGSDDPIVNMALREDMQQ
jgi:hypothetical protein